MQSNRSVIIFVTILCFTCASILSFLSSTLQKPQELARKEYLNKQLLVAADLLGHREDLSSEELLALYQENIQPRLTNAKGELYTFKDAGIDLDTYIQQNHVTGYAQLPDKLIYVITNERGYVIPINGFGLWDAIYGFLALKADKKTIIGTTWYEQKETPGLGAEIATPKWQSQFEGKVISPIGIRIVRPGEPLDNNSVDGLAGATKTTEAVENAYKDCLAEYRPFLNKGATQ